MRTLIVAGGGVENTISLLELLDLLEELTGKRSNTNFQNWRPSDQKVYISDITHARELLNWRPKTGVRDGIKKLIEWLNTPELTETFK